MKNNQNYHCYVGNERNCWRKLHYSVSGFMLLNYYHQKYLDVRLGMYELVNQYGIVYIKIFVSMHGVN